MPTQSTIRLSSFVAGEFRENAGDTVPSLNPTHPEDVVAHVPVGSAEQASETVAAAEHALGAWSGQSGPQRAEYLYRWATAIEKRASDLAEAVVREVGKPIGEARGEVARCVAILRYYAGEAVRAQGEVVPGLVAGHLQYSVRRPLGVVALITPWNFPLAIPLWKAAPAIALGNTVVLKPAEQAAYTAMLLAETAKDADLPAGVFSVIFGKGSVIGDALLSADGVRGVSFTGSDSVGARVARIAAERNIRYQTEMGGKNVGIVLADADLTQAANLVAAGAMRFAGQKCTATSRCVVMRQVHGEFMKELVGAIEALPVGDPAEAATAVGPVIAESAQRDILAATERAGKPFYRGTVPSHGFFVPPMVFDGVLPADELAQEELFGPVLAVMEAADLEEALALANDSRFGLSASLFTQNIGAALDYSRRIEAGMVRVNCDTTGVDPHAPFGGVKGSSSGSREQGSAAKEFYTEIHTVQIAP